MYGFTGKILTIDLTAQTSTVLEKHEDFYKQVLGGSFLAAKLFEEAVSGAGELQPFAPTNAIVFATGPCCVQRSLITCNISSAVTIPTSLLSRVTKTRCIPPLSMVSATS